MINAVKNRLDISEVQAKRIAAFIMDAFGYESRIIDNILKPDERQLFYMLEAEGFLTTGRERSRLHDGREWMTHYWQLQHAQICHFATHKKKIIIKQSTETKKQTRSPPSIYTTLSDDLWLSRKILNQHF
jgi:transcription initiation factor IIE alpha subunit